MREQAIELLNLKQPAVILFDRHGYLYTNQTGGLRCNQPEFKGGLVPIQPHHEFDDLFKPKEGEYFCWDEETKVRLKRALETNMYHPFVDVMLLEHSEEAWVYFTFAGKDGCQLAVLTWQNSD